MLNIHLISSKKDVLMWDIYKYGNWIGLLEVVLDNSKNRGEGPYYSISIENENFRKTYLLSKVLREFHNEIDSEIKKVNDIK